MKIAVLAGGPSCEREISLISGKAVYDAFCSKEIPAVLIDPVEDTFIEKLKREKCSIAFLALHGTFGEDGTVQRILEEHGIFYTGAGEEASERAFDKWKTQTILKEAGIRVPSFHLIRKGEPLRIPQFISEPFVVKPTKSGSSVGVSVLSRAEDFENAAREAFRYSDAILVEAYIRGREITVGILGDEALPAVEVIAARSFYDYEAKYKDTSTRYACPAGLSSAIARELARIALATFRAVGCEVMARVDFILGSDGHPYVLELNTIPGMTDKSLLPKAANAHGIDFAGLCVRIIELSRECRNRRKENYG